MNKIVAIGVTACLLVVKDMHSLHKKLMSVPAFLDIIDLIYPIHWRKLVSRSVP